MRILDRSARAVHDGEVTDADLAAVATVAADVRAARAAADRKDLAKAEELAPGPAESLAQATR